MDFMPLLREMGTSDISLVAAFFIGLMMAVSPCPLATNITAVAYVSRKIGSINTPIFVGLAYTLGRAATYTSLASLIVYVGLGTPAAALLLQNYGEKLLGPLLVVVGLVMVDAIRFNFGWHRKNQRLERLAEGGYLGAFFLGVVFAMAFCPLSGVLYFGMLIPLALAAKDGLVIPATFALGTGLPVIVASVLLVKSIGTLGRAVNKIQVFEEVMRKAVGLVFIVVGAYYLAVTVMG